MKRILPALGLLCAGLGAAQAQTPPRDVAILFGKPGWVLPGASTDMDFANGRYYGLTPSRLTTTRASTESEVCNGTLTTFPVNQPAITPGCGLWVWEARTNSIRNSTMAGAVIGTPGTLPTNWFVGNADGMTTNVINTGVINGFPFIDVQITGSPTGTAYALQAENAGGIIADSYGQTWTASGYFALSGGNLTNVSAVAHRIRTYNSSSSALEASAGTSFSGSLTSAVAKYSESFTPHDPTNAYISEQVLLTTAVGQAVNVTLRIAAPQLELNPNTPATVASAALGSAGSGYSPDGPTVLAISGGTCTTTPTANVTVTGGSIASVDSIANAGSCTALPASPFLGGGGCSADCATVTITPTDNSAKGLATGPILTSGAAATRQQSLATKLGFSGGAGYSIFCSGTPASPLVSSVAQICAQFDDGTSTNRITLARTAAAGLYQAFSTSPSASANSGAWAQGSFGKLASSVFGTNVSLVANGAAPVSVVSAGVPTGFSRLFLTVFNGSVSRVALWPNTALPSAQLQAITR